MEGKRNTVQRQLILEAVKTLNVHATAEQVVEHLAKIHPSIGRATVYRNLNQMAEGGELIKVGTFYGSTHYDHNTHEHFHFICTSCKQIFDISGSMSDVIEDVQETEGFEIDSYTVSFDGLCNECKNPSSEG